MSVINDTKVSITVEQHPEGVTVVFDNKAVTMKWQDAEQFAQLIHRNAVEARYRLNPIGVAGGR